MYAEIIRIAKSTDGLQWTLGDALLKEVGENVSSPTGGRNSHDGTRAVLEEISRILHDEGLDYTANSLATLRVMSWKFPRESRESLLSWSVHKVCGSPKMLQQVKTLATKERVAKITRAYAEDARRRIEAELPRAHKLLLITRDTITKLDEGGFLDQEITYEDQDELDLVVKWLIEASEKLRGLATSLGSTRSHLRIVGE